MASRVHADLALSMKNESDPGGQPRKIHRRNRIPLACEPCRARKQKCNRKQPCQNCVAHDEPASCHFRATRNDRGRTVKKGSVSESQDVVGNRIERLESLVQSLVQERGRVIPPESPRRTGFYGTASESKNAIQTGQTVLQGDRSVFVGGYDWRIVLEEINELKRSWAQEQELDDVNDESFDAPDVADGSSLLLNQVKPLDLIEIVASLPSKATVDKLIARFFDRETFPITIPPILHEETFMREYEERWRNLSEANFIWLALLFSILGVVMLSYHMYGEPPEYEGIAESLFQLYRTRTAQCLRSGDISKCSPYTLEALRLNATAELNRKDDNRRGLWMMTGLIVRAAVNMGYHRDPEKVVGISPLQAEYRRRVWLSVITMDTMASFLAGLPRMTAAIYSDTKEPLNVYESEWSEGMKSLPPSRSLEEYTPATYLIVKGRLFEALGRVADVHCSSEPPSYEHVLETDRTLADALANFPSHMKISPRDVSEAPFRQSIQPALMSSLNMTLMYHRGMCMLHTRFQGKAAHDKRFELSRHRCVSSALEIVSFQEVIWEGLNQFSLTRQLLILASMVLLLELETLRAANSSSPSQDRVSLTQSEPFTALERSCRLWKDDTTMCSKGAKIFLFLDGKLGDFRKAEDDIPQASSSETWLETPSMMPLFSLPDSNEGKELDFGDQMAATELDPSWSMWDSFLGEVEFGFGMASNG